MNQNSCSLATTLKQLIYHWLQMRKVNDSILECLTKRDGGKVVQFPEFILHFVLFCYFELRKSGVRRILQDQGFQKHPTSDASHWLLFVPKSIISRQ